MASVTGAAVLGLAFMDAAAAQLSCRAWADPEAFFTTATVADVARCLEAGANLEAEEDKFTRRTPLHVAAEGSDSPEVAKAPLDAGANLEARGAFGLPPCSRRQTKVNRLKW